MPGEAVRQFTNPLTGEVRGAQTELVSTTLISMDSKMPWPHWTVGIKPLTQALLRIMNAYSPEISAAVTSVRLPTVLNHEAFDASTTQATATWDVNGSTGLEVHLRL